MSVYQEMNVVPVVFLPTNALICDLLFGFHRFQCFKKTVDSQYAWRIPFMKMQLPCLRCFVFSFTDGLNGFSSKTNKRNLLRTNSFKYRWLGCFAWSSHQPRSLCFIQVIDLLPVLYVYKVT